MLPRQSEYKVLALAVASPQASEGLLPYPQFAYAAYVIGVLAVSVGVAVKVGVLVDVRVGVAVNVVVGVAVNVGVAVAVGVSPGVELGVGVKVGVGVGVEVTTMASPPTIIQSAISSTVNTKLHTGCFTFTVILA